MLECNNLVAQFMDFQKSEVLYYSGKVLVLQIGSMLVTF